ncbi:MAG: YajQ family cyclic di-GMP-binding protein [Bdellovibrionota bacterium]
MASFDIVSEIDMQEVDNAVNTAKKELANRYDFRGGNCEIVWEKEVITLKANDEMKINAIRDILQTRLHKRGVDFTAVKFEKPEPIGGMMITQVGKILQGIEKKKAQEIVKSIKDSKLKVQPQIMDEQIRVTGKSFDELQATIEHCKTQKFGVPLQFTNMRA